MKRITVASIVDAPADAVWREARTSRLLFYVTRGRMSFAPVDPPAFPDIWEPREYLVSMRWRGFLPIGRQIIGIGFPPEDGGTRFVRDNGRSALIKTWDHLISITPREDGRTDYEDRLDIEAGVLTQGVAAWAKGFYAHRQRRWARLAASGFDYST